MNFFEAQLEAQRVCEETGMSMADVAALPLDEYARLAGRQTPAQAALAAFQAQYDAQHPTQATQPQDAPQSLPQPPATEPQGVDIASMTMEQYALFRQQAGIGAREYGVGLFNQSGSWANAARAKAGRSAMAGNRNTIEAPRIGRAFINHDDRLDHRSARDRFYTPGNSFGGR